MIKERGILETLQMFLQLRYVSMDLVRRSLQLRWRGILFQRYERSRYFHKVMFSFLRFSQHKLFKTQHFYVII